MLYWRAPTQEFRKEILQVMQVGGAPTQRIRKEILQVIQVGEGQK